MDGHAGGTPCLFAVRTSTSSGYLELAWAARPGLCQFLLALHRLVFNSVLQMKGEHAVNTRAEAEGERREPSFAMISP